MFLRKIAVFLFFCLISQTVSQQALDLCAEYGQSQNCFKLGEKFYLINPHIKLSWFEAERACHRQNAFLANIENEQELNLISSYLTLKNLDMFKFWIGFTDLATEGTFYSSETGEIMKYSKWLKGEPNGKMQENCVHVATLGEEFGMNDTKCIDDKSAVLCEIRAKQSCNNSRW